VGRGSVVGVATFYWLDGPVIESRWGRGIAHPNRLALGPTQPPIQWVPGLFHGRKAAETRHYHLPSSSAEVKERVELYFCSPSGRQYYRHHHIILGVVVALTIVISVWQLRKPVRLWPEMKLFLLGNDFRVDFASIIRSLIL
jgi:hypothetical protein